MMRDSMDRFSLPGVEVALDYSGHTDRGAVRRVNEDSFLATSPVFAIADGMGGHAFGDRASRAAIDALASAFTSAEPTRPEAVIAAIRAADDAVSDIALSSGDPSVVSGTTLTGIALVRVGPSDEDCRWMVFNVGDSRVYSWDGRDLTQLSVDHSVVQELIDGGRITREDAATHPSRNIVTRALGAGRIEPDIWLLPATGRQSFIVCSDGLTRELSDDEVARQIVLHQATDPERAGDIPQSLAERLVLAAVAAGGADNVTVVTVQSQFAGADDADIDTLQRDAMPSCLEETLPRRAP